MRCVDTSTMSHSASREGTERTRVEDARQPDGRIIVYEETPWDAADTGRWIVGEPVDVRR